MRACETARRIGGRKGLDDAAKIAETERPREKGKSGIGMPIKLDRLA